MLRWKMGDAIQLASNETTALVVTAADYLRELIDRVGTARKANPRPA